MKLLISYEGKVTWGSPEELSSLFTDDEQIAKEYAEILRFEAYSPDENEHILGGVRVVVHDSRDEDPLKLIPTGGGYRLVDFDYEEIPGEVRGDFTLDAPGKGHFVNEGEDSQIQVIQDESGSWITVGDWEPYEDPHAPKYPEFLGGTRIELKFDGNIYTGEVYPAPHAIKSKNDEDVARHGVFVRDSDLRVLHVEERFDGTWGPAGSYWWRGQDACLRRSLIEELRNELFETRLESDWGTKIVNYMSRTGLENSVFKIEYYPGHYSVLKKSEGSSKWFYAEDDSEFVQFLLDNTEVSDHLLGFEVTPHFQEVDRFFSNLWELEDIGDFVIDNLLIKDGKTYQLWLPGKCFETLSSDQVVKLPTERIAEYNERFEDILEKEREKINQ